MSMDYLLLNTYNSYEKVKKICDLTTQQHIGMGSQFTKFILEKHEFCT